MEGRKIEKFIALDFVMIALALASIVLLIVDVIGNSLPDTLFSLEYLDLTIALIFLGDFIYHLKKADNKLHFFKTRWWELLAAIPITTHTTEALRTLKLIRFIPLLEGFRIVRYALRIKVVLATSKKYTHQTYLIEIAILIGLVLLLGASGFHYFELGTNPNIHTFFDSFWWAIGTVATVGYGDVYPITTGGRVVAIFLIFSGIGLLGAFITIVNNYVLENTILARLKEEKGSTSLKE